MSKHVMAVADYYQLVSGADGYQLDGKKLLKRSIVPRKQIERVNEDIKCGKLYIIDEDATDEAFAQGAANVAAIREAEESKADIVEVLADVVKTAKKGGNKKKSKKVTKVYDSASLNNGEVKEY